jgi:hypothetical protein
MATIKIDRGFTQKIQQKGLIHSPDQMPQPHKHNNNKKPKGRSNVLAYSLVGGAVLLGLIVLAVVFLGGDKDKKKSPQQAEAGPGTVPPPKVAPARKDSDEIVDPDEALYASHSGKPAPQTVQASKPGNNPPIRPVQREIQMGGAQGLRCDYYQSISGKQISSIRAAADFPDRPSKTVQVGAFELSEDIAENYGVRVRGYLVPPETGKYRFSVCADDGTEFWLSKDDTPTLLRKMIGYEAWVPKFQWTNRADQQSAECELVGGRRYYLEAFLKESSGHDYLMAAWKGPVSDTYVLIEGRYLQPWADTPTPGAATDDASAIRTREKEAREAALAPARAAVEEQQRKSGASYRYAEAADVLKNGKSAWTNPEALALVENAILRFELLGRLRALVQAELAKAPVRGVWTAFGGQADVTGATDEGVTVAPGRIVGWAKIPADQMLKLVNATLSRAVADPTTKGLLFLGAAVFCKEASGGIELSLKYRERAVANHSGLSALAERVLGGTPESLQAEIRIKACRAELGRLAPTIAGLEETVRKQQTDLASVIGLVPGVLVEYWQTNPYGSLNDVRNKGLLKTPPTETRCLSQLETPKNYAEKFVARLSGYLTPAETGEYTFYLAADDQGEFWLSSDDTPEKLALCVKTESYSNYRAWDKEKRRSKPVSLAKGQHYYVEALLREGEKDDHLSVAWSPVADDTPSVITSSNVLYAATAGFTPQAQELRQKIDKELQAAQMLLADIARLGKVDDLLEVAPGTATSAMADEAQQQVTRAKASLLQAEKQMKQIGVLIAQLKEVTRPVFEQK